MSAPSRYVGWLLGYKGVGHMARPTFRYDMLSTLFGALGMGVIMPALTSQFATSDMRTSIWVVALLFAQRSMGNLLATFFSQDLARRPRVPTVVMARVGIAMFLACIAALPPEEGLAGSFAALLVTPYLLASLIINLQSVTRHSNYPAKARGRIFSRLTIIQLSALAASVMLAGLALDHLGQWGHPVIYLLAAGAQLASAYFYSKIRVRRERSMLKANLTRRMSVLAGFSILREDRAFAKFMLWQMVFGLGNIATQPALTMVMMTFMDHYRRQGFGYGWAMAARSVTPLLVAVCLAPLAGRLFDHMHITRFRGIGAAMWGASKLLVFLAAVPLAAAGATGWTPWVIIFIAFAIQGMGMAVGNIAYNLGHMNFASLERSHEYMGLHLTLQGIRGLAGPLLGAAMFGAMGVKMLPIAAGMIFIGVAGFFFMKAPPQRPERIGPAPARRPFDTAGKSV